MGIFSNKKKKGHWIKEAHLFRSDVYICSVCKSKFPKTSKTCPKCGVEMVSEKYDPQWVDELEMLDAIFDD